jgi:hypothetical protein
MFAELQSLIPDQMWLIGVEGLDDNTSGKVFFESEAAAKTATAVGPGPMPMPGPVPMPGPGGAVGGGASTTNPLNAIREITKIRLVGYTVSFGGNMRHELKLESQLKNSKYFDSHWTLAVNRIEGNLSYFEIFLKLKSPIKK